MCEVDWQMLLEYLKLAFSWPPVVFAGAYLFVRRFQSDISKLISRVEKFKAGNVEATIGAVQQAQAATVDSHFPPSNGNLGTEISSDKPSNAAPQSQNVTVEVNWVIPEEALRLSPLLPHIDLQKSAQWVRQNPGPSIKELITGTIALKSERCLNLIFGTQVEVLGYLQTVSKPSPTTDLLTFYEKHVVLIGRPQAGPVTAFLTFLTAQDLIENIGPADGPLYRLTNFGAYFLGYIKQFYPFIWDKRPL